MASTVLGELQSVVQDVGRRIGPSVVTVGRAGCGVVIGKDRVATNAHNIRAEEVSVGFAGGRGAVATVAALDADADLAVLTVDTGDAPAVEWDEGSVELGAVVLAVARSAGGETRVTFGPVSTGPSVGRAGGA